MSSRKKNTAKHPASARHRTKRNISFPPSVKETLADFPTPENFILRLEKEYKGAKLAFKTLTADGADPKDLRSVLLGIALHLTLDSKVCFDRLAGLPRYTLKRFPDRLNAIANEVDKLNDSQLLNPSNWLAPQNSWDGLADSRGRARKHIAADFSRLPALLRWYAEYVKGRSKFIGKVGARRGFSLSRILQMKLLGLIRTRTGQSHYDEVAILMTAIYSLAGQRKVLISEDLRKFYKRNPLFRTPAKQ